ncbi:hypothetical protein GIB67_039979 [Kingdonia uniflora]|uniref:Uncharacterized protein n=1 Tax=Kingdonia uniflora TaxID=39325 RepID=A0A7J7P4D4_9MAGN|nr:hypothetical protein GIB67_039979 [Kingdonia uniflora]
MKPSYFNRWINFKVPFNDVFGGVHCNLKETVQLVGISWEGCPHCGLDYASNTARLLSNLMSRGFRLSISNSMECSQTGDRLMTAERMPDPPRKPMSPLLRPPCLDCCSRAVHVLLLWSEEQQMLVEETRSQVFADQLVEPGKLLMISVAVALKELGFVIQDKLAKENVRAADIEIIPREPNPKVVADTSSFFDVISHVGNELNQVLGELGIRKKKRLNSVVEKVQRSHQKRAMAASGSAYADAMEISTCAMGTSSSLVRQPRRKIIVPSSEQKAPVQIPPVGTEWMDADGVNLEAVVQEALDLATRDLIRLDTQIQSSISQLSVTWKSAAEVLKLAVASHGDLARQHNAEKATLREQFKLEKVLQREQFKMEKALQKDKFEKEAAATKQEVEDEAKKAADITVASQNKLIQAFYFWVLSREDVDLALAGKYGEIVIQGDDSSPVAEQTPAPPLADDPTKEVRNKLENERRLHKLNFDKTFKELFKLQSRYGKIKTERGGTLRKYTDRFVLLQKSLKRKRFIDESDKLEFQRSLLSLTHHFEAEVDSEWGLKEAYLELLTESDIVLDLARVKFLEQKRAIAIVERRKDAQLGQEYPSYGVV